MKLGESVGALTERNFHLVFSSTTISAIGDGVASIALVFAVLHISHDSPTAVGAVLACRQVAAAATQAVVQGIVGTFVVTGHATVALLAGLGVVYGLADGFVIRAQNGLIPVLISAVSLQQANALIGLSRSLLHVAAPALGGILVAAASPGGAILNDAASFAVAAVLLARVAFAPRAEVVEPEPFLRELREGWARFRRQRWIFNTIVFFGLGTFAGQAWGALAPLVMKEHYGGDRAGRVGAGVKQTLIAAGVMMPATSALVLAQPVVWSIRPPAPLGGAPVAQEAA